MFVQDTGAVLGPEALKRLKLGKMLKQQNIYQSETVLFE